MFWESKWSYLQLLTIGKLIRHLRYLDIYFCGRGLNTFGTEGQSTVTVLETAETTFVLSQPHFLTSKSVPPKKLPDT